MEIRCPYCFEFFCDDQVHFRSEYLAPSGDSPDLPEDFDDYEEYQRNKNKVPMDIQEKIDAFYFFQASDDEKYMAFWKKFGGTTETEPNESRNIAPAYKRRVLNPGYMPHANFLQQQPDGSFLIRDPDGMVEAVKLKRGEICNRRVCPHCHNPLPNGYGKSPVKIATVIGITGSGKTVFLSQLLRKINLYAAKVGLVCTPLSGCTNNFVTRNEIRAGRKLPQSTPDGQFQQPLFFNMRKIGHNGHIINETFVLYDVAGELFQPGRANDLQNFAPYVQNSNGIICLVDPYQIDRVKAAAPMLGMNVNAAYDLKCADEALVAIHGLFDNDAGMPCNIPMALCISKADNLAVQNTFSDALTELLGQQICGVKNQIGLYAPTFNVLQYAPVCRALDDYFKNDSDTMLVLSHLEAGFSDFSLFAFTAMGCDVREQEEIDPATGKVLEANSPIGPVEAVRIEEPLLWLFYKFGYIDRNGILPMDDRCPYCKQRGTKELPEGTTKRVKTGRLIINRWKEVPVNRQCQNPQCDHCGAQWYIK